MSCIICLYTGRNCEDCLKDETNDQSGLTKQIEQCYDRKDFLMGKKIHEVRRER